MTRSRVRPAHTVAAKASLPKPEPEAKAALETAPEVEPVRGQVRYRVTVACTDFTGRYREPGEIVEVPAGSKVPQWFEPLADDQPKESPPPANDEPLTLSEVSSRLARELAIPGTN